MAMGDGWERSIQLARDDVSFTATLATFAELAILGNPIDLSARADFSLSAVMRRREDGSFELLPQPASEAAE